MPELKGAASFRGVLFERFVMLKSALNSNIHLESRWLFDVTSVLEVVLGLNGIKGVKARQSGRWL